MTPDDLTALDFPALDRPLGSLDFRLRRALEGDETFRIPGRRAVVMGTAAGLEALRFGSIGQVRGPALVGATGGTATETPLGVERRLSLGNVALVERVVVARDAPVAWLEWVGRGDAEGREDAERRASEFICRVEARGVADWDHDGRRLVVDGPGGAVVIVLSVAPESWGVERVDGGLDVRARVDLPADGLRLAALGIGPDDNAQRLLRIAGRSHVGVRGREGAVNRLLADGLSVVSPDPDLDDAVAWARIRLDASRFAVTGEAEDIGREARARLAAGDFASVRDALDSPDMADPGKHMSELAARYLAWSGDRATVQRWGPSVEERIETLTWSALEGTDPIARVVHGLLRAAPDAPRGRLVLRPRLPEGWDRLEVRGIRVGGSAVTVAYGRDGDLHTLRLEQTLGAAPLQVVLEPELPGREVAGAHVDGAPAELTPDHVDGRWRVPVQIVLDHPRLLEVELPGDSR